MQNSQESPNRKLLSREIFNKAEKEAQGIIQKRSIPVGKIGEEFLVNTYERFDQTNPSVARLSNGKFVVTWQSAWQDGSYTGIYGQIFNTDGTENGSEFQVNTYTIDSQWEPAIASLNNGRFIVTWQSSQPGDTSGGVYGQIFNPDGTKSGLEFQINTYTSYNQWRSTVAGLSNGNFVVAWESNYQDGGDYGIYGQIFNADGTKSGSEFQVNTETTSYQVRPASAALDNGKFVLTWDSNRQDSDSYGVYGQIFNADGTKSGLEFQINTYTPNAQGDSSVANLNNGKFVVTWASSNGQDGSGYGIYGQVVNEDGTKNGSEFQVNTYTDRDQKSPSVTSLNNDKFVVTWDSYFGVFGQIFGAVPIASASSGTTSSMSGTNSNVPIAPYEKFGEEFPVNTNSSSNPSIVSLSNTTFAVAWEGYQNGADYDVYGQLFGTDLIGSPTIGGTNSSGDSKTIFSTAVSRSRSNSGLSGGLTGSVKATTTLTEGDTEVVSGAERQVTGIALTVLSWMADSVKGALRL